MRAAGGDALVAEATPPQERADAPGPPRRAWSVRSRQGRLALGVVAASALSAATLLAAAAARRALRQERLRAPAQPTGPSAGASPGAVAELGPAWARTSLTGCRRNAGAAEPRGIHATADQCGAACAASPRCKAFGYRAQRCADGEGSGSALAGPACLVWEGDCDEEPSGCWDLYRPASLRQLAADALVGAQEVIFADAQAALGADPGDLAPRSAGDGDGAAVGVGRAALLEPPAGRWRNKTATSCSHRERLALAASFEGTADECRHACERTTGCRGFSRRPGPCLEDDSNGSACVLFGGACSPEPDACWELHELIGPIVSTAPASIFGKEDTISGDHIAMVFFAIFMTVKLFIIAYISKFLFCMPGLDGVLDHGRYDALAYHQKVPLCRASELQGLDDEEASCVCAVCLEPLQLDPAAMVRQLPCRHLFHAECLDPWVEVHGTCPTCRMDPLSQRQRRSHTRGAEGRGWHRRWRGLLSRFREEED